jgi:hypothetical protein
LYAYVLTHSHDSRNFAAIGKIPKSLGGSLQVLISAVNPISWLFAGRNGYEDDKRLANGFQTTGGLFSRVAILNFFDESQRQSSSVTIRQEFLGYDSQSNSIGLSTHLEGFLPNIDPNAQVVYRDFSQKYTRYSKG